jgi:sirohydrochlorin ferrochelatase
MRPARLGVVLVAHGSRDPRAAAATRALALAVGEARPDWEVSASYLDHSLPRPAQVLGALEAAGHRRAVLVPLLLTAAYHGRVDVPGAVVAARAEGLRLDVEIADVLGPLDGRVPSLLLDGLIRKLPAAGLDAVVLAAAGTRDAEARSTVELVAAALSARLGLPATVAYASAAPPTAGEAVSQLRADGASRVGMAAYFLAPGLLYDIAVQSALAAGAVAIAEPLEDTSSLVRLVESRVGSAASRRLIAA